MELFLRGYTLTLRLEDAGHIVVEEIAQEGGGSAA
jgi:hypothetical protein